MVVDKKEYIGKRISWDDMVKYFPDRWIVINDYTIKKGMETTTHSWLSFPYP